ncbi:MAG: hypothetical protein H0V27_00365 [Pyrinomonadaceae bacterium]|nr:hypothetical protein [Pyrinomonadaceae bacterium]
MKEFRSLLQVCGAVMLIAAANNLALAQGVRERRSDEFGPVVRAYLGYLDAEREVVDDRASRREISPTYYRRNQNRIRALRFAAIRIARETGNDYLPELEAVTRDEFKNIFDPLPKAESLRAGTVINHTFRFLSTVRAGEIFYVFARLDPYEQADLIHGGREAAQTTTQVAAPSSAAQTNAAPHVDETVRPRRAGAP